MLNKISQNILLEYDIYTRYLIFDIKKLKKDLNYVDLIGKLIEMDKYKE